MWMCGQRSRPDWEPAAPEKRFALCAGAHSCDDAVQSHDMLYRLLSGHPLHLGLFLDRLR